MQRCDGFVLRLRKGILTILICGILFCPTISKAKEVVVASTSLVGAIAKAAGAKEVRVLTPAEMRHPPEYDLKPSDLLKFKGADIVVYGGYERMVQKLLETLKNRNILAIQIETGTSPENLIIQVRRISKVLNTENEEQKWEEKFLEKLRELKRKLSPFSNKRAVVHHYMQPYMGWHNRVLSVIKKMKYGPNLIADAGYMYVAKMSGHAEAYDLFTPDIGELAFLADELAPHPLYTRGFLLHEENRVSDLITRAYVHRNASKHLLIKVRKDYVANKDGIQAIIDSPSDEAMEATGGTGDTLTGIVAALIASGMGIREAAITSAKVNRLAGVYARPTPATQVKEIIQYIPQALGEILSEKHEEKHEQG